MLPAWMINDIKRRSDDEDERAGLYAPSSDYPTHRDISHDDDDDNTDVLNAGSGGGSPPPAPQPNYEAEANAQMRLEEAREARAEKARLEAEERAAAKLKADTADFQGKLGSAYNTARDYGSSRLNQLGINDEYGIMSAYDTALQSARGKVPNLDPNPGSYFGNQLFDDALASARTGARNKLTKRYETEVPVGYENTFIPDTADDVMIENIISGQYGEAGDYLSRARERGQLNDIGYNNAMTSLKNARSGAVARANDLGMGVLETGRQSLRDIDKGARSQIADWDFGDAFDADTYEGRLKSKSAEFTGGLEGRLRNAFGSTEFFDPDTYLSKGTKAQGSTNAGASALQDAITEEERRRTSGSVGAF